MLYSSPKSKGSHPKKEHSSCLTVNDFECELRVGNREGSHTPLKQLGGFDWVEGNDVRILATVLVLTPQKKFKFSDD